MLDVPTKISIVSLGVTILAGLAAAVLTAWYTSRQAKRARDLQAELDFKRIRETLYPGAWLLHQAARGFLPSFARGTHSIHYVPRLKWLLPGLARQKKRPDYLPSSGWIATKDLLADRIWDMDDSESLKTKLRHALRYSLGSYHARVLLLLNAGANFKISSTEQEAPFLTINRIAQHFVDATAAPVIPGVTQSVQRVIGQCLLREAFGDEHVCIEYWEYLERYEVKDSDCRKAFDALDPWIDAILEHGADKLSRLAHHTADLLDQLQKGKGAYMPTQYLESLYDIDCLIYVVVVSKSWFKKQSQLAGRRVAPPGTKTAPPAPSPTSSGLGGTTLGTSTT